MKCYHLDDSRPGPIRLMDGNESPLGWWSGHSLLAPAPATPHEVPTSAPHVLWSGSMAERDLESDDAAQLDNNPARWAPDPRTWGPSGWAALDSRLAALAAPLIIRTHARHVVSDTPGIVHLLRAHPPPHVNVLVDPVSMLTPEMLKSGHAADHLRRTFEAIASPLLPRPVAGVIVAGVCTLPPTAGSADPSPQSCTPTSLLHSDQPPQLAALIRSLAMQLPAEIPRVLIGDDAHSQRDWLLAAHHPRG